jgi:hypothetical protein
VIRQAAGSLAFGLFRHPALAMILLAGPPVEFWKKRTVDSSDGVSKELAGVSPSNRKTVATSDKSLPINVRLSLACAISRNLPNGLAASGR